MPKTLLQVAQEVAREVGLDADFDAFTDFDETNLLKQYINRSYNRLIREVGTRNAYQYTSTGSFSTIASTGSYSLPTDTKQLNKNGIYITVGDTRRALQAVTLQYAQDKYPNLYTYEAIPQQAILLASAIQLYPIPDDTYLIEYYYAAHPPELLATTDTFIYPDPWLDFIVKDSQYQYEKFKGIGELTGTKAEAEMLLMDILTEAEINNPSYFYGMY